MDMIFGQGTVRFEREGVTIDLELSSGSLGWEDENTDLRTVAGELLRFYEGSRAKIKTLLKNMLSETDKLLQLMTMFNAARADNQGVVVYPQYNGAASRGYRCHLMSEFSPHALSAVGGGQTIELSWESVRLYEGVPAYTATSEAIVSWLTHTGAQMNDHTGTVLEFRV